MSEERRESGWYFLFIVVIGLVLVFAGLVLADVAGAAVAAFLGVGVAKAAGVA